MPDGGLGGALRRFRSYPLRSALLVTALALGVGVVVAVAAFLEVAGQTQRAFAGSLWARELTLQTREDDDNAFSEQDAGLVREVGLADDSPVRLRAADMERARAAAPSVDYAYVTTPTCTDIPDRDLSFDRIAVSRDYFPANGVAFTQGAGFSASDFAEQRRVVVLSERLAGQLALGDDPVGQTVQARDCDALADFTVVGVMAPRPGANLPDFIIPFRPDPYNAMNPPSFVVADVSRRDEARAELAAFAQAEWGGRVTVRAEDLSGYLAQGRTTALLTAVLASLGLAGAAMNIMNLALARVLAGRREVGVLRSLGATRRDIRGRYFADALAVGVVGGLLGVAFGYGFLAVFNLYLAASSPVPTPPVTPSWLSLGVGFAAAVGSSLLFTLYPAQLAARASIADAVKEA